MTTMLKEAQKPRIPAPDLSEYKSLDYREISAFLARATALYQEAQAIEDEMEAFETRIGRIAPESPGAGGLSHAAGMAREGAEWLQDFLAETLMNLTGGVVLFRGQGAPDEDWPYAEEGF